MTTKKSRDALLEMCVPIEVVRGTILRDMNDRLIDLENRLQEEVKSDEDKIGTFEAELAKHYRLYRWWNEGAHGVDMNRYRPVTRDIEKAKFDLEGWKRVMDDDYTPDDSFFIINDPSKEFYIHNPPKSWRDPPELHRTGRSWSYTLVTPVDGQQDVSTVRGGLVFLYGFELKDVNVFERPTSRGTGYHEINPPDPAVTYPDYNNPYTYWHPHLNNLLLILEKDGQLPCWVSDNTGTTTSEVFADNRKWKIDPSEWAKMIGQRIEFLTTPADHKPVYMPQSVWDEHSEIWQNYEPCKYCVELETFNKQNPIELVRVVH